MSARLRAMLREPLVHFVVLGGLVFAIGQLRGDPEDPRVIRVTPELRERLAATRDGATPPSAEDLQRRVDAWVAEEMLYREGVRLGLDRDDPVIRRRIVQKMEFVQQSAEPVGQPTEQELEAFLAEYPARYGGSPRYDFVQIVVPHAEDSDGSRAREWLAALHAGAAPEDLGARVGRSRRFTLDNAAGTFGPGLATALTESSPGEWTLVELDQARMLLRVDGVEQGEAPPLSRVRNRVELDWKKARGREIVGRALEQLRAQYHVEEVP